MGHNPGPRGQPSGVWHGGARPADGVGNINVEVVAFFNGRMKGVVWGGSPVRSRRGCGGGRSRYGVIRRRVSLGRCGGRRLARVVGYRSTIRFPCLCGSVLFFVCFLGYTI